MTDLLIRNVPDEVLESLDKQASVKKQSRQAYILALISGAASVDYVPSKFGEGYRATTQEGGKCSLIYGDGYIQGGAKSLSQSQHDAYQKAKLLASPKNGSQWIEARKALEAGGFEVWNV